MPKYVVPVRWTMTADMIIEADNENEAANIAIEATLPEGEYLSDSFEVDDDVVELLKEQ